MKGRKPTLRRLPPLREVITDFQPIEEEEHRLERVYEMLKRIAQQARRAEPHPFYPMREVAGFFGVSLTTVAKAYKRLNGEGWLTTIRSSQTVVPARTLRSKSVIRGVVCMPVWSPGYLQFLDWRALINELELALSHYHLAPVPIFYRQQEELKANFTQRVLQHNPDIVLWHCPHRDHLNLLQGFGDHGIRVMGLLDEPMTFPGTTYVMSWERAMRACLLSWKDELGIQKIVIPRGILTTSVSHCVEMIARELQLEVVTVRPRDDFSPGAFLKSLPRGRGTGVVMEDDLFYARLAVVAPRELLEMMQRSRVLVMRRVTAPSELLPDLLVDHLSFDWKMVADRIALEINRGREMLNPRSDFVFHAQLHRDCRLSRVIQGAIAE